MLKTQEKKVITVKFDPQDYQRESLANNARFKVIIRGRRGGKTEEELQGAVKDTVTVPGLHWIVGPSYRQMKSIAWTRLKAILRIDRDWKFNEQELYAEHPHILDKEGTPTRLELKGADKEDSLVGVGLRSLRVDEAALLKPIVWEQVLRPMLADHVAPAYFYSTPRGRNYLYDLYLRGQDPNEKDWASWRQPTNINRYIPESEIQNMRMEMSERMFSQEVLAEFLEDDTGVFKGIRRCVTGELRGAVPGRLYIGGVDLAKTYDFSVITIFDSVTRELVYFERFNQIEWVEQKLRIQNAAKRYNNAFFIIDSTGVGDPILEDLRYSGVSCEGFNFGLKGGAVKHELIENAVIAVEQRLITFPMIEVLINELFDYGYELMPSGRIKYSAPSGKHDDCVIALALACWGLRPYLREVQLIKHDDVILSGQDKQGLGDRVEYEEEVTEFTGY